MRFEGKVAIVTGASKGIGKAVCVEFAKEGADVVVVGHSNLGEAEEVANEVRSLGRSALAIAADVSKSADVDEMVEKALEKFGKIDILVNNAAPSNRGFIPILDMTEAEWDKYIDVCLKGTFLCSKAVGAEMVKRKQGKIINMASNLGEFTIPGRVAYCSSKAGILHLTRSFALEWGKYNINVNSVSPAGTLTGQLETTVKENPGIVEAELRRLPISKYNDPEDVAYTVLFLASSESEKITGQDIRLDSGMHVLAPSWVFHEER